MLKIKVEMANTSGIYEEVGTVDIEEGEDIYLSEIVDLLPDDPIIHCGDTIRFVQE